MKTKKRILLSTYDKIIDNMLSKLISREFGNSYDLEFVSWEKPFEHDWSNPAETDGFDIYILLLNNCVAGQYNWPQCTKSLSSKERGLWLIQHLRDTHNKPVIIFTAWANEDSTILPKANEAGATYAFPAPFDASDMMLAIDKCIERVD